MHRAQVILEKWQYDTLKARSEQDGRSVSDVVREAVSLYLGRAPKDRLDPLDAVAGIGADPEESGRRHDRDVSRPTTKRRAPSRGAARRAK